jgi:hypothetical protein
MRRPAGCGVPALLHNKFRARVWSLIISRTHITGGRAVNIRVTGNQTNRSQLPAFDVVMS